MSDTLIQPATKSTITCKTSEVYDALKFLSSVVPRNKKGKLYNCEVTIKTNEVTFVTIGAKRVLYCECTGPAKVTLPLLYFFDIIKNIKTFSTQISVSEGLMTIGNLSVQVITCFFEDYTILRSIDLPINYSIVDLLLLNKKYTPEEIEFNKLNSQIKLAYAAMDKDINTASGFLEKYGVTNEEIRRLVQLKLFDK